MNDEEQNLKMFSMNLESVNFLLRETEQQLDLTEEYLKFFLTELEYVDKTLVCLISEYYSCNFTLIREIKKCLEYNAIVKRDEKEELVLTDQSLSVIETSAIGRYLLMKQLADYSLSTYFN